MRKILLMLTVISFLGCTTTSRVYVILGHRYPKYLKCEDCTNMEKVKIASDRIMKNYLDYALDKYGIEFYETEENVVTLWYVLKEPFRGRFFRSEEKDVIVFGEPDAMIEVCKQDCRVLNIARR